MASSGETDQLVICLSCKHRDLSLIPRTHACLFLKLGIVLHGCDKARRGWKQAEVWVTGQSSLLGDLYVSEGPCLDDSWELQPRLASALHTRAHTDTMDDLWGKP